MKTNDECPLSGSVIGAPLGWLRVEGVFVFILSILFYARAEASWWLFLTMLWAPDLSIAGHWLGARVGAVAYNVAHSYVGPVALAGVVVVWPLRTRRCFRIVLFGWRTLAWTERSDTD